MSLDYLWLMLRSNFLEYPAYFLTFYFAKKIFSKQKMIEYSIFLFAMNSITHPIVFFHLMALPLSYLKVILIAETFAIVTEAFLIIYFLKIPIRYALPGSFLANLISWQFGPMISYLLYGQV